MKPAICLQLQKHLHVYIYIHIYIYNIYTYIYHITRVLIQHTPTDESLQLNFLDRGESEKPTSGTARPWKALDDRRSRGSPFSFGAPQGTMRRSTGYKHKHPNTSDATRVSYVYVRIVPDKVEHKLNTHPFKWRPAWTSWWLRCFPPPLM